MLSLQGSQTGSNDNLIEKLTIQNSVNPINGDVLHPICMMGGGALSAANRKSWKEVSETMGCFWQCFYLLFQKIGPSLKNGLIFCDLKFDLRLNAVLHVF